MSGNTTQQRLPLEVAERLAMEIVELLRPACERIEVAGSIRRRKCDCGDIELVAIPRVGDLKDLFDNVIGTGANLLDDLCFDLKENGVFSARDTNGRGAWGPKYKRLSFEGFPVDLFSVMPPAQWGAVFAIRTGPAEFSHNLVRDRRYGGLCPEWAQFKDGCVVHRHTGKALETPEEADLFRLLGIDWIEPEARA